MLLRQSSCRTHFPLRTNGATNHSGSYKEAMTAKECHSMCWNLQWSWSGHFELATEGSVQVECWLRSRHWTFVTLSDGATQLSTSLSFELNLSNCKRPILHNLWLRKPIINIEAVFHQGCCKRIECFVLVWIAIWYSFCSQSRSLRSHHRKLK